MTPIPQHAVPSRAFAALFAEDFDDPPGVTILDDESDAPAPDDPEPAAAAIEIPAIDLDAERADAFARGRDAALADIAAATADHAREQTRLLAEIAARLADAEAAGRVFAERSAEAVARLLLGAIAGVLPAACARHGEREAVAIARAVLPALTRAPEVTIRAHPENAPALRRLLGTLDPRLRERVRLADSDRVAAGDLRIAWADGEAARDAAALWRGVAAVLAEIGLIDLPPSDEGET
jgi:flagellar biosynthesis/type III secretory pathway protein FliH